MKCLFSSFAFAYYSDTPCILRLKIFELKNPKIFHTNPKNFQGAYFGWMSAPPLAGLVLAGGAGPMVLFYSSLGLAAAHLLLFLVMTRLAAGLKMAERTGVDNEMAQL